MKVIQRIVEVLTAPKIESRDPRYKYDNRIEFIDKYLLPILIPGYVRPVVRLQRIDETSSRRKVKK